MSDAADEVFINVSPTADKSSVNVSANIAVATSTSPPLSPNASNVDAVNAVTDPIAIASDDVAKFIRGQPLRTAPLMPSPPHPLQTSAPLR
jgi:hypothetical protein